MQDQHHNWGAIHNAVGSILGAGGGVLAKIFTPEFLTGLYQTAIYALVGAVVGFAVTQILKKIFKVKD